MANKITDVLWAINHEVDKLSGIGLDAMAKVLDAAEAELTADLARWKALAGGDAKFTAQVYRNALIQIRGSLDRIKRRLNPAVLGVLQYQSRVAGNLATSHLIREVESFSMIFSGSIRPVAIEAASVLASGNRLLWPHFKTSSARYVGAIGDDIRKQLAIGVVRGETIDGLTARLAKHSGPRGLVSLRGIPGEPGAKAEMISEGLFTRYRYWGERLARTEVVNAYNQYALSGIQELDQNDPGYFKRWDAAIDGRLCPLCRELDDRVVKTDAEFLGGFRCPPRHPNCRCALVAWRKEWKEADVKDDLLKETTRGSGVKGVAKIPHTVKVSKTAEPSPSKAKKVSDPISIPKGFSIGKEIDGERLFNDDPKLKIGIPGFKQAKKTYKDVAYVVSPTDLSQKPLHGIDFGNVKSDAERIASIKKAWKQGIDMAAVEVDISPSGKLFVRDGNHRLLAAAEDNRLLMVRFRPVSEYALEDTTDIREKLLKSLAKAK